MENIRPLLEINEAIVGFCSDPLAIVELSVLPANQHRVYRAQYRVAEALMPAVSATIKRWLAIGRITFATPGCPYNNPVLAAPKKDEHGTMTAVRLCIDVRLLNTYLEQNDRFILPRIPDLLATFGGFMLFGEFDLSEAFSLYEF
jgi:hypothetical protein